MPAMRDFAPELMARESLVGLLPVCDAAGARRCLVLPERPVPVPLDEWSLRQCGPVDWAVLTSADEAWSRRWGAGGVAAAHRRAGRGPHAFPLGLRADQIVIESALLALAQHWQRAAPAHWTSEVDAELQALGAGLTVRLSGLAAGDDPALDDPALDDPAAASSRDGLLMLRDALVRHQHLELAEAGRALQARLGAAAAALRHTGPWRPHLIALPQWLACPELGQAHVMRAVPAGSGELRLEVVALDLCGQERGFELYTSRPLLSVSSDSLSVTG